MMLRFVTFVDGSNLDGVLKHLNLRVDDYGAFYRHVFEQSVHYWGRTFAEGSPWPTAQHSRIYWYVVGKMDEWDLNDPKAEARLRARFEVNPRLRDAYVEDVLRRNPDLAPERRVEEAWHACFAETREWYDGKKKALERKKRFYHGVQSATDFVEIRQEGHWKVVLLHHTVNEKGLRKGSPADFPGKGTSSRLKIAADFVVQVYESELLRRNLAYRAAEPDYQPASSYGSSDPSY